MTSQEKISLKLKIIQAFKGLKYTLIDVYEILDDLKRDIGNLAIDQELKKMKLRRK